MAALIAAGLLLGAGIAAAQNADVGGTITQIDAVAHTVTFSDGRIAHYEPLWRILVNGREVALTADPPGAVIAVAPSPVATTTAVVPGTSQPAMVQVPAGSVQVPAGSMIVMTPTPGYAPATVARIDHTTKAVTLSDGRVVTVTEIDTLQPGTQVYVSSSVPAAQVTTRGGSMIVMTPTPGYAPATVARIDRTTKAVTLSDGRVVTVTEIDTLQPGAQVYVSSSVPAARITTGGVQTTTVAPAWKPADREMRGRVQSVDARGTHVVLSDGRTVYVSPAAATRNLSAHTVTVTDLQPGDEVVIQVQEVIPVAGPTAGAVHAITVTPAPSLPSYTFPGSALVAPDRVVILRYPEAV
jgi:hypothetical protein